MINNKKVWRGKNGDCYFEKNVEAKVEKNNVKNKIEAKSIYFDYDGQDILQNINLTVKEGEFIVFMGPSGSGKSNIF